jgi:hypothetical protein
LLNDAILALILKMCEFQLLNCKRRQEYLMYWVIREVTI